MSYNVVKLKDYRRKYLTDKTDSDIISSNQEKELRKQELIKKKNEEVKRKYKLNGG